jgi:hypothetical protein
MLINDSEQYRRTPFMNEAEIEGVVQKHADLLFGSNILYLSQTRIRTMGGKGSIPDAIVIDLEREEWYLVEAERAVHGTWDHIAPQVSKQLAALTFADTRQAILQSALSQVAQDPKQLQIFTDLEIQQIEIHGYIQQILQKPVVIAIPIDGIPKDLTDWIQTLRNHTRVWLLEKFVSVGDESKVLYSLPDENLPTIETVDPKTSGGQTVTTRSSQPYQELIETGLLKPGESLHMEYGPRGAPRQKYSATVREEGLEIDGKVFSASYAAVHCINKAGSPRKTANGWILWRNANGQLLNDLYQKLRDMSEDESAKDGAQADAAVGLGVEQDAYN